MKNDSIGLVQSETLTTSLVQSAVSLGNTVAEPITCVCGFSETYESETDKNHRGYKLKKTAALYVTMVAVSTCAIFLLEHASIFGAFRTALVAAIGKTFAASWVTSLFD